MNSFKVSHAALELETEVVGKTIRIYWGPEKEWYTGKVAMFNSATKEHKITYNDNDEEIINLLELDKDRRAWEFFPFTTEYFGF